jgi:hypothetical protein
MGCDESVNVLEEGNYVKSIRRIRKVVGHSELKLYAEPLFFVAIHSNL